MSGAQGYSRGPNGGGVARPAAGSPAYTRGPNGAANAHPQNRPAMAGAHPAAGGASRHDFHAFVDFHQNFNAPRHFHAAAYRSPPGWYSHHWVFGEFLPVAFWARSYWLTNYMAYALAPPPYGAVWVRVGDDALLVDQDSGEVITVEYGVFY
jgi:Ni/Co efflux regulator RcnB